MFSSQIDKCGPVSYFAEKDCARPIDLPRVTPQYTGHDPTTNKSTFFSAFNNICCTIIIIRQCLINYQVEHASINQYMEWINNMWAPKPGQLLHILEWDVEECMHNTFISSICGRLHVACCNPIHDTWAVSAVPLFPHLHLHTAAHSSQHASYLTANIIAYENNKNKKRKITTMKMKMKNKMKLKMEKGNSG